jgi:hypothetical protein
MHEFDHTIVGHQQASGRETIGSRPPQGRSCHGREHEIATRLKIEPGSALTSGPGLPAWAKWTGEHEIAI